MKMSVVSPLFYLLALAYLFSSHARVPFVLELNKGTRLEVYYKEKSADAISRIF